MKAPPSWGKWLESFDSDGVRRKLSELLQDKSSLSLRLTPAIELERALEERRRRPPLPTGLGALDRLQEGGLPRGSLIEVSGRRSSGRFALALAALAAATAAGEPAALVDPADQLDPEGARSAGVVLERLLWLRPDQPRQTLSCAEALCAIAAGSAGPTGASAPRRRQTRFRSPVPPSNFSLSRLRRERAGVRVHKV